MLHYDELLYWIEESGFELVEAETYFDSAYLRFACGLCLGLKESLLEKDKVECVFSQQYSNRFRSSGLTFKDSRHCLYWPTGDSMLGAHFESDGVSNYVNAVNRSFSSRLTKTDLNLEKAVEMLKRMLR